MTDMIKKLFLLFAAFFKVGLFTFGGGYAMIPIIKKELVDRRHWLDEEHFFDSISITQAVPGAVAVNLAVFYGYNISGVKGAVVSMVGVVLPSFITILFIVIGLQRLGELQVLEKFFMGVRPAVVSLILYAAWQITRRTDWSRALIGLTLLTAVLRVFLGVSPVIMILGGAVLGGISYFQKRKSARVEGVSSRSD